MTEARIQVGYRVRGTSQDARDLALQIAYEQTVELPVGQVSDPRVLADIVGRVESVRPDSHSAAHHHVTISHAVDMANGQLSQLLNLIYGNVSIYPGVRLTRLDLPPELLPQIFEAWSQVTLQALQSAVASLAIGFLVLGILPSIEQVFGITTGMTLAELRDPRRPLLQQLQQQQQALRDQLQQMQKELEGMGMQPSEGFGEAGEAMGDAEGNLGGGQPGDALGDQGRALQALREGAQDMMNQMMQAMGQQQPGNGQQPGPYGQGNSGPDDRDPLGRPRASNGPDFGNRVKVPDEIDIQRAREILDAIRKRLGDRCRRLIPRRKDVA